MTRPPRQTTAHPSQRSAGHRVSVAQRRALQPRSSFSIPIALKYMVVSGIILVTFLIVVGRAFNDEAAGAQNREINKKGIASALTIASWVDPYWARGQMPAEEKSAAASQLRSKVRGIIREQRSLGFLDIMILPADRLTFITIATERNQVQLSSERPLVDSAAAAAGVTIIQGQLSSQPARSYECPILLDEKPAGYVRVFLSAQEIEDLQETMSHTIMMMIMVAVLVALPVVTLVGFFLTRPIRVLKKDMAAVASGDLQYQSSVRSGDELEELAQAFNRMTAHLAEAQDREAGRKALERELSIATSIQRSLLPDQVPDIPGYDLHPFYAPAKEVGGDYYDFIPLGPDRYAVVVADVSGKGVPGSLVMAMTRSLMRMAIRESQNVAEFLTRVNASLSEDMTRGMFVTMIVADFDARSGLIRLARAGHNPAYHYRSAESKLVSLQPGGIALGLAGDLFGPNLEVTEVRLGPGDVFVLYTDGVIEAMDSAAKEYTPERFEGVLAANHARSSEEIVQAVLDDVARHTRGSEPSDDLTLLVIRRQA